VCVVFSVDKGRFTVLRRIGTDKSLVLLVVRAGCAEWSDVRVVQSSKLVLRLQYASITNNCRIAYHVEVFDCRAVYGAASIFRSDNYIVVCISLYWDWDCSLK
jgi:hypothetical protein